MANSASSPATSPLSTRTGSTTSRSSSTASSCGRASSSGWPHRSRRLSRSGAACSSWPPRGCLRRRCPSTTPAPTAAPAWPRSRRDCSRSTAPTGPAPSAAAWGPRWRSTSSGSWMIRGGRSSRVCSGPSRRVHPPGGSGCSGRSPRKWASISRRRGASCPRRCGRSCSTVRAAARSPSRSRVGARPTSGAGATRAWCRCSLAATRTRSPRAFARRSRSTCRCALAARARAAGFVPKRWRSPSATVRSTI